MSINAREKIAFLFFFCSPYPAAQKEEKKTRARIDKEKAFSNNK